MTPRRIALVGAATIAAGLILQQLVGYGLGAAAWASGTQLDQSLLEVLLVIGSVVASIAVPLGAAVLGGGIVLLLAPRTLGRAAQAGEAGQEAPIAGTDEPTWVAPSSDAR